MKLYYCDHGYKPWLWWDLSKQIHALALRQTTYSKPNLIPHSSTLTRLVPLLQQWLNIILYKVSEDSWTLIRLYCPFIYVLKDLTYSPTTLLFSIDCWDLGGSEQPSKCRRLEYWYISICRNYRWWYYSEDTLSRCDDTSPLGRNISGVCNCFFSSLNVCDQSIPQTEWICRIAAICTNKTRRWQKHLHQYLWNHYKDLAITM